MLKAVWISQPELSINPIPGLCEWAGLLHTGGKERPLGQHGAAPHPPPLSCQPCSFTPWKPALLPCPLIFHLPQHILSGSAPGLWGRTFIWMCLCNRMNLYGSVPSGVFCYGRRIFNMKVWRAAFIVHRWRESHRIQCWVLLQNKGLNFDLQS